MTYVPLYTTIHWIRIVTHCLFSSLLRGQGSKRLRPHNPGAIKSRPRCWIHWRPRQPRCSFGSLKHAWRDGNVIHSMAVLLKWITVKYPSFNFESIGYFLHPHFSSSSSTSLGLQEEDCFHLGDWQKSPLLHRVCYWFSLSTNGATTLFTAQIDTVNPTVHIEREAQ